LRDRFGNVLKLDFYKVSEIAKIIYNNSDILELGLSESTIDIISKKSR
jgi:Holliday junction resolvasome RuvABC ATP-dependent DNA helicase subunit